MNTMMNSMVKRIIVRGLFLAGCIISLTMQPSPGSADNNKAPGTVTTWGEGTFTPSTVVFPEGVVPVAVSAYEYAGGLAITSNGGLYSWFGVSNAVPVQVVFPPTVTQVKAVSQRFSHTLALTDDGLYAWGANFKGQFLFGWTPNPGTAFYLGYNDDINRHGFNPFSGQLEPGLRRNNRTFFIKMSYLFRRSFGGKS